MNWKGKPRNGETSCRDTKRRVLSKEESVDKKANAVEKRELECTAKFNELQEKEKRVNELEEKGVQELERVSGLTSEQAKEELLRICRR